MSRFLSRCVLEVADDQDDGKWILLADLHYESDIAVRTITVPAGFQTDLASVPRLPFVYLLCGDCARQAAVIHDRLYTTHEVSRSVADEVLREASAVTGVPWWRRNLMFAGVRLFGRSHWGPEPCSTSTSTS